MSTIRTMLTAVVVVALTAPFALAQDTSAPPAGRGAESFEAVKKEFRDALKAHSNESKAAREAAKKKGDAALKAFRFDKPLPTAPFSPRFLAVAERDPEGPDAIEALDMTLRTSHGPKQGSVLETRGKAVKILHDYYANKPSIKKFLPLLVGLDDEDSRALVADVIARNPDRRVQAAAYKELIAFQWVLARFATDMDNARQREAVEKASGKDFVKKRLARVEKAKVELEGLRKIVRTQYGDLVNDLAVGNAAPEIIIRDIDGKEARLSALKGKVVVLDIWTTWCKPCKAMIPHEREMVARLKDKPFALVSISADEKKETLTNFLAKTPMPWTHWWNGSEGGILEDWDVRGFPQIYVLDAQGVIRHRHLRDEELEKAVNALLNETATTVQPTTNAAKPAT